MSRRPLPTLPRLSSRRDRHRAGRAGNPILLACPRANPEWELAAIRALIKPQLKGRILYRDGIQRLPAGAREHVEQAWREFGSALGSSVRLPRLHLPDEGDYFALSTFEPDDGDLARTMSVALSRRVRGPWWVCGRLFVRDGRFYRRQRGIKLNLVPARDVHLPRELRAAVQRMTGTIMCEVSS